MKLGVEKLKELIVNGRLDHRGRNVIGNCPKCGGDEFGISIEDNHRFGCYRKKKCGWSGNIFSLLKFLGKLHEYLEEGEVYSRTQDKLINRLIVDEKDIDLSLETITPPIGWKRVYSNEYLLGRGFTESDFHKHIVGTTILDPKLRNNYIIFLEFEGVDLKAWVARHIWDKTRIESENIVRKQQGLPKIQRYRNSETDFSKLLGGYNDLTDSTETVILVEGKFDLISVNRLLGLDSQEEVKCCCTWKCHVSDEQIYKLQQFKNVKNIILLYDPDVTDEIKKVIVTLEDKFPNIEIGFSENGKDPGDMSINDLEHVLSNLYQPEEFLVKKIQKRNLQ